MIYYSKVYVFDFVNQGGFASTVVNAPAYHLKVSGSSPGLSKGSYCVDFAYSQKLFNLKKNNFLQHTILWQMFNNGLVRQMCWQCGY